jgi:hypothetical protein
MSFLRTFLRKPASEPSLLQRQLNAEAQPPLRPETEMQFTEAPPEPQHQPLFQSSSMNTVLPHLEVCR